MDAPMPAQVPGAWTEFFRTEGSRPAGLDVYPDIFNAGWLFPLQRMRETAAMIALARTIQPRVVMEIGSDKGGSFYHWVKGLPSVEFAIAAEIRGIPFKEAFTENFRDRQFLFQESSSYDAGAVDRVQGCLAGDQIDCLFIDGDKGAFDRDFDCYLPMIRKGGIVFLHDIQDADNPAKTFAKLRRRYRSTEIIDTSEYEAIAEREAAGLPPATAYEGWFRIWKRSSCGVGVLFID